MDQNQKIPSALINPDLLCESFICMQNIEINFIELDFSSPESLRQTLTKHAEVNGRFDFIVHGAGVTKVSNNADFYNVNVQNTKHFTDALIAAGMIPEKFILHAG